jgi:Na+/H+-dicarboxylate symporter
MAKFSKKRTSRFLMKNLQLILTLLSVVVGVIFGLLARSAHPSSRTIELIGFPGEILMSMLKMTILPLIAASLISGMIFIKIFESIKSYLQDLVS